VTAGHGHYSTATDSPLLEWQEIMQIPRAADKAQNSHQALNERIELMTSLH
jgi:hypothetical protein